MGDKQFKRGQCEIEVENFGPIVHAGLELRPLTVFIGPSNAGKSCLAALVYAMHRAFHGAAIARRFYEALDSTPESQLPSERDLQDWVNSAKKGKGASQIPMPVRKRLLSLFTMLPGLEDDLEREICRCFNVADVRDLMRRSKRPAREMRVEMRLFLSSDPVTLQYKRSSKSSQLFCEIPDSLCDAEGLWASVQMDQALRGTLAETDAEELRDSHFRRRLSRALLAHTGEALLKSLERATFYLPADRTGMIRNHHTLVSALVHHATIPVVPDRQSRNTPILPGIQGDFLQRLVELGQNTPRKQYAEKSTEMSKLAQQMERDILGGIIRIIRTETIKYPFFEYAPDAWDDGAALPLTRASSMVSDLAPLALYLRHLACPGDTLIIEEPESHLHPELQIALALQLVRIVKSGVHVMMTTHSELMLEQLTNLVNLSDLTKAQRKGIEAAELTLTRSEFGAWRFVPKKRPKGVVVKELAVEKDGSTVPPDYSDVTERLYNQWAQIGNRIANYSVNE